MSSVPEPQSSKCPVSYDSSTSESTEQRIKTSGKKEAMNLLRFTALRYAANIEWVGGAIGGNALRDAAGINGWAAGAVVASAVTLLEFPQAKYGAQKFSEKTTQSTPYSLKSEAVAGASALWQGAGATAKVNSSLGLSHSSVRLKLQSAAYGVGVGLWSTPLPGFRHGVDAAESTLTYIRNNPLESGAAAGMGSLVLYAALEGLKNFRARRKQK